jgi:prepilin-type processing-associated H-X9-DG protein
MVLQDYRDFGTPHRGGCNIVFADGSVRTYQDRNKDGMLNNGFPAKGGYMDLFECEATFEAEPAAVWKVWTDVARWPEWDVSKEIAQLDGPFEAGTRGWARQRGNLGGSFTITEVDAGRHWVSECPVPLGKVVFDHTLEPVPGGLVRVVKSAEVLGGAGPLLLLFAPRMRRDTAESLAALRRQASHQ